MSKSEPIISLVPREFVVAPFFAATPQKEPREISIEKKRWVIGIDNPIDKKPSPTLDIRHGKACIALMTFRDRLTNGKDIHFSMNELCRTYANSQGGRYARDLLGYLNDLRNSWVSRETEDGKVEFFTILGDVKISQKAARRKDALKALSMQQEMWLDRVSLSPEFFGLMEAWERLARIRLDVLTQISSPKAQAIYTYIPSRAVHHDKNGPFPINLATILEQIGAPVPDKKGQRKKVFTQNKHSIISQLDGLEVSNGGILRVVMEETKGGEDHKLLFWVETGAEIKVIQPPERGGKMLTAWLESGRSKAAFQDRVKASKPLEYYHRDLLEKAKIVVDGNERFFEMALALLGTNHFEGILAEAKGDHLEGNKANNANARINFRILDALKKR